MPRTAATVTDSNGNRIALVFELAQWDNRATVTARVRLINAAGDIGYGWDDDFVAIDGLQVESRLEHDRVNTAYDWTFKMSPRYGDVDLPEAERLLKTLRRITNKLAGMVEDGYGEPATFGAYVARIAKASGIRHIGFRAPHGREFWASGERIRLESPGDGARHIDYVVADWLQQTGQYAPAAA